MFRFMLWLQKQYVLCLRVTKTIWLQKQKERGYKNIQRENGLQKHTERKKNNPVTKTGLQKKFYTPPLSRSPVTSLWLV